MKRSLLLCVLLTASGCTSQGAAAVGGDGSPGTPHGSSSIDGGLPAGGGPSASGLPCDVQQLLSSRCQSCHSDPPTAGAPMPLTAYASLMAPAKSDKTKRVADLSLARMQNAASPMPPAPAARATPSEIATMQTWIAAGLPMGSCGSVSAAVDGGSNPYGTPTVCTSNGYWMNGNSASSLMHPGVACISCHSGGEGPQFVIAGTVYPTAHEPNDCNGAAGGQVVITDAKGQTLTLTPNSVGNFFYQGSIAMPFHAKVVKNGAERAMAAAPTNGDCNACHTLAGDHGAPGRIMLP